MSKVHQVMEFIRDHYFGWALDSDVVSRLVLECSCSPSTIYRAIRQLRQMNAIEDRRYTGCWWVDPESLVKAMRRRQFHSRFHWRDTDYEDFRKAFFAAENRVIYDALQTAIRWGLLKSTGGNSYGWMLYIMENAS